MEGITLAICILIVGGIFYAFLWDEFNPHKQMSERRAILAALASAGRACRLDEIIAFSDFSVGDGPVTMFLLTRLEEEKLISSHVQENGAPHRVYLITETGKRTLRRLEKTLRHA